MLWFSLASTTTADHHFDGVIVYVYTTLKNIQVLISRVCQVWNDCICRQDSDGDGKTNGEELGDPDCAWTPGQAPARTTKISHPGSEARKHLQ